LREGLSEPEAGDVIKDTSGDGVFRIIPLLASFFGFRVSDGSFINERSKGKQKRPKFATVIAT
jgi:hypothetical protein